MCLVVVAGELLETGRGGEGPVFQALWEDSGWRAGGWLSTGWQLTGRVRWGARGEERVGLPQPKAQHYAICAAWGATWRSRSRWLAMRISLS